MEQNIIKGYIYKITNIKNEMSYIGKTTYANIQRRFDQHEYYALTIKGGNSNSLHQAIRDFGINNFTIEIIDTIYEPDSLEQKEKEYIALYHTYVKDPLCKGYNQSKGGEGHHVIRKNKRKQYQMIDINTNEVINIFESGCDAGRCFQMDRPASASTCIARAIQRNGTWRGYKWKQNNDELN